MKSESQKQLEALIMALKPDDEKQVRLWARQWATIWAMQRTFTSIEKDGKIVMCHELSNEDYLKHINQLNPLADFIEERKQWAKTPYGQGSASKAHEDDMSAWDVDEILNKYL